MSSVANSDFILQGIWEMMQTFRLLKKILLFLLFLIKCMTTSIHSVLSKENVVGCDEVTDWRATLAVTCVQRIHRWCPHYRSVIAQCSLWISSVLFLSGKRLSGWLLFVEIALLEKSGKYLLIQDKCGNAKYLGQNQIRSNIS